MPASTVPAPSQAAVRRIGVLSDTHGHLPAEVVLAFAGVDLILHAGDLDTPEVLARLRQIAPVVAVRGNMDRGPWARRLSPAETIGCGEIDIYMCHILHDMDLDPVAAGFAVVISGHTHRRTMQQRNGILFLNPGSASMPRGADPPSVALLTVSGARIAARFVDLEATAGPA
jgi:putative phosphoesterase